MQGYYFSRPLPLAGISELLFDLQAKGARAEWRLSEAARVVSLVPGARVAHAA